MIGSFGWQRLTDASQLEHRVDGRGALLLRAGGDPPFDMAHVRDGVGGRTDAPLAAIGFVWEHAGDGWALRTHGEPKTMTDIYSRWGALATRACAPHGIDPRLVLTTIACEVGDRAPDAEGLVKAPRTEVGYPQRTGEMDPGDFERDAEDWANYVASGETSIAHSSHGLMQTLISTAVAARPDLFRGVDPAHYRTVLWHPANAIACGVAHASSFPRAVLSDPLAFRFKYGSGSIRPSTSNRWGTAPLYDELVPLAWIAFWNDVALGLHRGALQGVAAWLAALAAFGIAGATTYAAIDLAHRRASERSELWS